MTDTLWWIVGAYAAVTAALLLGDSLPHARERAVLRFENSLGLTLPAQLGEPLRRRMVNQRRSYLLGGVVGIAASATAVTPALQSLPEHLILWTLFGGMFTGAAIATAIAALFSARPRVGDHERLARATAVALDDYLAPLDRWTARLPVVFAVAAIPLSLVGNELRWTSVSSQSMFICGVILAAMAVTSLVVFEVAARRIVAKGRPIGSLDELVWDDAFRFQVLRDLRYAPLVLSAYALGLTGSALGIMSAGVEEPNSISFGVFATLLICTFIALWAARAAKTQRHFLRRLWPELAAEADNPVGADA
ncbi:hypothetical protein [Homoserinimonas sp. A520]